MKTRCHVWREHTITVTTFTYKQTRKGAKATVEGKQLSKENWDLLAKDVKPHLEANTRFDLYATPEGFEYLPVLVGADDPNDLLDDDLMRSFEQGVRNTKELTKSKWSLLAKVGIVFLVSLMAVGGFLLFTVMLNQGQTDFGSALTGIAKEGFNVTKVFGA